MYVRTYVGTYTCVLCCFASFVCLTLLASFFLPSHLSFKNMYVCMYRYTYTMVEVENNYCSVSLKTIDVESDI